MKCIFLDFDGVINNWYHFNGISKSNVEILKIIKDLSNSHIIVTSSNKYSFQRNNNINYYETSFYKKYILPLNKLGISIDDFTPYVEEDKSKEIKKYLKEHKVDEFLILDDELVSKDLQEHQVFLDLYQGLQEEHIIPSLNILNAKLGFYPSSYNREEKEEELILRINKYYKK